MNFVLYRKGFPMFDIPYAGRSGYYRALERAQTKEEEFVFVRWFMRRYLNENTRAVRTETRRGSATRSVVGPSDAVGGALDLIEQRRKFGETWTPGGSSIIDSAWISGEQ